MSKERFSPITHQLADAVRAAKQKEERLELEGNSVFQDLRMERDALREQRDELLEALETIMPHLESCLTSGMIELHRRDVYKARTAIQRAKGEGT